MSRLYVLSVRWVVSPINPEIVDRALHSVSYDWLRFDAWTWFVYSASPKQEIVEALKRSLGFGDNFILMAVQPEAAVGMADKWVWDWLNSRMLSQFKGE